MIPALIWKNYKNKNIKLANQYHLNYKDKINLGAFYTPQEYVNIVKNN